MMRFVLLLWLRIKRNRISTTKPNRYKFFYTAIEKLNADGHITRLHWSEKTEFLIIDITEKGKSYFWRMIWLFLTGLFTFVVGMVSIINFFYR